MTLTTPSTMLRQGLDDSLGGFAVPQRRNLSRLHGAAQHVVDITREALGVRQTVAAECDCDRSLSIRAQGEAGSPEKGAFLLQTPGVGKYKTGSLCQSQRVEVANWLQHFEDPVGSR